jgi:hypothetical protein
MSIIDTENVGCFDDGKEVSSLGPPAPEAPLSSEEATQAGAVMTAASGASRYVGQVILEDEGTEWEYEYTVTASDLAWDVLGAAYRAQAKPASGKGSRRAPTRMDAVHDTLDTLSQVVAWQTDGEDTFGFERWVDKANVSPEVREAIAVILEAQAERLLAQAKRVRS